MNYCELLYNTDAKYLDFDALIDGENGSRLTYGELMKEVRKAAKYLRNKGCTSGSVVSTHLYNCIDAAVILLAVQYIGGVACLVDPLYKAGELIYYLQDSGSKCMITHLEEKDIRAEIKDQDDVDADIINIEDYRKEMESITCEDDTVEYYNYKEDELAMLLYTSGTSSKPKGVMLTTGCFFTYIEKNRSSLYTYIPEDRILCFVPFSHGFGSVSILIPSLAGKSAIVFLRAFQPVKISKTIISENITHMFGVPTHYQQLLRYESMYDSLRKLKAAFSAAAPLSHDTALTWYKTIGIYLDEGYGMTETTTLIATRMSRLPEPAGNVGFPPSGILEVDIVDENGNVCEDGIIGEIRVSGRGIMLGYLNKPVETLERLREGKVYTGDNGYKRSDGSIVLCGRKTEFINVAGLKISPLEIEAVLNSHKDVVDSAAVGVEDATYGQIVKAFVVLKDNATCTERELIKYVSEKVANFKIPKYIVILDEFPRNNLGKIDKKALKSY